MNNELQNYVKGHKFWLSTSKDWCLLYPLAQVGRMEVLRDDEYKCPVKTAYTDGYNVFFHEDFYKGLSTKQQRYLMLHELMHKAGMHFTIYKDIFKINPHIANIACDIDINNRIESIDSGNFTERPPLDYKIVNLMEKYKNMPIRKVFRELLKDAGNQEAKGFDSHELTDEDGESKDATPEQLEEIRRALEQGKIYEKKIRSIGSDKGNGDECPLGDLIQPQHDWKAELCDFVRVHCSGSDESTWRRPNRKFAQLNILRPSGYSETVNKIVVGIDTSGSCFGTEEMTAFMSEVNALLEVNKPRELIVAYVDTEVVAVDVIHDGQIDVRSLKPKGGGGTNLEVLYPELTKLGHNDADALIWFSDGYTEFTTPPPMPVLWCLTENVTPSYGRKLRIDV